MSDSLIVPYITGVGALFVEVVTIGYVFTARSLIVNTGLE